MREKNVRNLLAFSPLRRPRMNLEEEGDKGGADGKVLEEILDDFGDMFIIERSTFLEEKKVVECRSRRAKSRSRVNFYWGIERVYIGR